MNTPSYFNAIGKPPETITPNTILIRMIDGLGFRFRAATEELTENDMHFRPSSDSFSIFELLQHIYDLAFITQKTFGGKASYKKEQLHNFHLLRNEIMTLYQFAKEAITPLSISALSECSVQPKSLPNPYPFWYVINGHIADALTHVGQLVSWRRINGNPQPKTNVFLGEKIS